MKKVKLVIALAAFYFLFSAAWQVGACELANIELKDDMQDMVSQFGERIGNSSVPSDTDVREAILRKAEKYNIALSPDNVIVMRTGEGSSATLYLEADYNVLIYLPRYSFQMYFAPSTARKPPNAAMATRE